MSLGVQIGAMAMLLVLSGFFSGSEVALVSLTKLKVRRMVEQKKVGSLYVEKLKDNPQRMLATILVGNNLVNVAASAITTSMMIGLFESYAVGIATGVMTMLILVFGELTPKSLATQHNERVAQLIGAPIWYLSIVLTPIISVLDIFLRKVLRVTGVSSEQEITEEEIRSMVTAAEEEGSIKSIEREMIHNIFEFDDIAVREIATPRADMKKVDSTALIGKAAKLILKWNHSRIPVYKKKTEKIVGILYEKDVMRKIQEKKHTLHVTRIMKKPYFVPETKKVSALLRQFQKRKEHLAIMVDEHGLITGLVTLEDVLEEIVGEIMDETDRVDPHIKKIKKNVWVVKGKTDIEEVNEKLKMGIRVGNYDTMSGFILTHTGKIPKKGEVTVYNNFKIKVQEIEGHRIAKVRVERM